MPEAHFPQSAIRIARKDPPTSFFSRGAGLLLTLRAKGSAASNGPNEYELCIVMFCLVLLSLLRMLQVHDRTF